MQELRSSPFFSEKEKAALEFAERLTEFHLQVDDECFEEVRKHFRDTESVSLTSAIAIQNDHAKFNGALRVDVNAVCPLPLSRLGTDWR